ITEGEEVIDQTSIHPKSYEVARKVMKYLNISKDDLGKASLRLWTDNVDREKLAKEVGTDKYTLDDILDAFVAPQRDPRDEYAQPLLKSDVLKIEDLS